METATTVPEDKAAWLRKRRRIRKKVFISYLFLAAAFAGLLWQVDQKDKQERQEAIQYREDCARAGQASSGCEVLMMQVYEHRKEVYLDPDSDDYFRLSLKSKSGRTFEVDTTSPQWDRIALGTTVTAVVWNGEVEEVSDSGGTEEMKTNPARRAEDNRLTDIGLKVLGLICFCFGPISLIIESRQDEKRWAAKAGNDPSA